MASIQAAVMVEPGNIEVRGFDRPQIGADELISTVRIYDPAACLRSLEILSDVRQHLTSAGAAKSAASA